LTTVVSAALRDAATSPWASGRNQMTVLDCLTPRRSPAGVTTESVLVVVPEVRLLIRATCSVAPV
jgi:hypothetical protein